MGLCIGASVSREVGSTMTPIPGVRSCGFPPLECEDINIDSFDNPDYGHYTEPGMVNAGELDIDALYDASVFETLFGELFITKAWEVSSPSNNQSGLSCQGYIKGIQVPQQVPATESAMMKIKVKLIGIPELITP